MKALSSFVSSHIWIGCAAFSSYLFTCFSLNSVSFESSLGLLILCSATALYNLLARFKKPLALLNFIILIASLICCFFLFIPQIKNGNWFLFFPPVLIGFFYGFKGGLRKLPFIKIFLIAIIWVYTTTFLPIWTANNYLSESHLIIISAQFLFLVAVTIPFDIRDLKYDDDSMKTIPQLIGSFQSKVLSAILLIAHSIILIFYPGFQFDIADKLSLFFVDLLSIYIIFRTKENSPKLYFTGLIDGMLVIQGVLIFLF